MESNIETSEKEKKAVARIAMTFIDRLDANICRNNQIYFNERSKITGIHFFEEKKHQIN